MTTIISSKSAKITAGLVGLVVAVAFASVASAATFTTNLKVGSKGADVKNLQVLLNSDPATQVSESGAGSPGMETSTFGPATKKAVIKFQNKYASDTLTPAGLTAGTGFVGALTRAKLNTMGGMVTTTTTTTTGCVAGASFSATTGLPCSTTTTPTTTTTTTSGPVSVSLANDNPAASAVVAGQATADLAHFTFSGSGTITNMKLMRTGISSNSTLSNVYLYKGNVRVSDGASVNNTDSSITFNNLNIVVGGSATLSVKADILTGTQGQVIGVQLVGYTVSGSTAMTSANISGNYMNIAGADMARVSVQANTVGTGSVNAGNVAYTFWSAPVTVSVRAASLKGALFKFIGSAPTDALANIKLYVNGTPASVTGTMTSAGDLSFDFGSSPLTLATGVSTVEVRADVVKGSSRTVSLSLQNAADLMTMDSQLNVNVAVVSPLTSSTSFSTNTSGVTTINPGSVTINQDAAFSNITNLVGGATGVKMAAYKFTAWGEDVKVSSLAFTPSISAGAPATTWTSGTTTVGTQSITVASTAGFYPGDAIVILGSTNATGTVATIASPTVMTITFTTTGVGTLSTVTNYRSATIGSLVNVGLYVNGGQVGSSQTVNFGTQVSFPSLGSNLIIPAGGSAVVEIKGDIVSSSSVNLTAGAVKFDLVIGSSNAQGVTSSTLLSTAAAGGQTLTISSGNVSFAQTSGWASSISSPNQAGKKIGSFTLQTGSSEGVTISNVLVGITGTMISSNQITNLTVKDGSAIVGTPIGNPTATNNYSVSIPVSASTPKTFDVYADIGSGAASLTVIPAMTITYRGSISNVTTVSSAVTGATISAAVSQIAASGVTFVPSSSVASQFVLGGQSAFNIGTFNIKASSTVGGALIKDVTVTVPANTIGSVTLNGKIGQVVGTTATVYNVDATVPADASGINLPMNVSLVCVNSSGGCAGVSSSSVSVTVTTVTYNDGLTIQTLGSLSVGTNTHALVASKPKIEMVGGTTSGLSVGSQQIGTFTITADAAGDIQVKQIPIVTGTNGTITIPGTTVELRDAAGNTLSGAPAMVASSTQNFVFTTPRPISKGTAETYTVWATTGGTTGTVGTSNVTFTLGAKGSFQWVDVLGTTATTTGAMMSTYPTTTQTKSN